MNMINTCTRLTKPELVEDRSSKNENLNTGELETTYNILVNFDMEEITNRQNVRVWQFNFLSFESPLSYTEVLTALIQSKYSDEQALAIILNRYNEYEAPEKRAEHIEEHAAFQKWRIRAKEIAQTALEFAKSHNVPTV